MPDWVLKPARASPQWRQKVGYSYSVLLNNYTQASGATFWHLEQQAGLFTKQFQPTRHCLNTLMAKWSSHLTMVKIHQLEHAGLRRKFFTWSEESNALDCGVCVNEHRLLFLQRITSFIHEVYYLLFFPYD